MKRCTIFIILALVFSINCYAQRAQQYAEQLNQSTSGAKVRVSLSPTVLKALNATTTTEKVSGFRVCVFSDNSQGARAGAGAAANVLSETIGSQRVNMIYDNPFFRVYGGYCINKTEAVQLLGRIKGSFPRAFIVPMSFPIDNLSMSITSPPAADSIHIAIPLSETI